MGLSVREIFTSWGFEVDDAPLKKLDQQLADLGSAVKWVGVTAAGAAATIFGIAQSTGKAGDEAAKTAAKLGVNVEALQEFGHVANLAGIGAEGFNASLGKFVRGLGEAKQGSGEARDALFTLSRITGKNLLDANISAEDKLLAVSDAFHGMTDSTKKARLATQLFGREGLNMVNVLNQGSAEINKQRQEARDLGLVLSEDATKAAEEFEDAQTRLFGAFTGLRNIIGVGLIPVLTELIDQFKDFIVANRADIVAGLNKALKVMIDYLKTVWKFMKAVATSANGLAKAFGGWEKVTRTLLKALVLILALRLAAFLGGFVIAIVKVVQALRLMTSASILANLAAAAIPILIGAAIIALGLIIEDVIAFFQGKDSITGLLLDSLKKDSPKIFAALEGVGKYLKDAFKYWTTDFNFKEVWTGFIITIEEFGKDVFKAITDPFIRAFDWISEKFKSIPFADKILGFFGAGGGGAKPPAGAPAGTGNAITPVNPTPNPANAGSNSQTNTTSVQAPITVNVPPGTPPGQVANAARQGVKDAMNENLRSTNRATKPAVQY